MPWEIGRGLGLDKVVRITARYFVGAISFHVFLVDCDAFNFHTKKTFHYFQTFSISTIVFSQRGPKELNHASPSRFSSIGVMGKDCGKL